MSGDLIAKSPSGERDYNLLGSLPGLLTLAPLGWLVWLLVRYHVNVPYDFQLAQAFLLERSYSGQLSLVDIWQQQAMHRGFFPRLATLWIACMTRWDLSWEAAANVAMAGGILWALLRCLVRVIRVTEDVRMRWLFPAFALLVFSPTQWDNWLTGNGFYIFLCVLTSVWGLALLSDGPPSPFRLGLAILLGAVATYSFGFGAGYWPAGWLILRGMSLPEQGRRAIWLWLGAAVGVLGFYLWGLRWVGVRPLEELFQHPEAFGFFIVRFLGAPVIPHKAGALLAGLAGLTIFVLGLGRFRAVSPERRAALLPFVAFSVYAIFGGICAAVARAHPGVGLASRYTSAALLLWICVLVFLWEFLADRAVSGRFGRVLLGLLLAGMVIRSVAAGLFFVHWHVRMEPVRQALIQRQSGPILERLWPANPKALSSVVAILEKRHLSVFRGSLRDTKD